MILFSEIVEYTLFAVAHVSTEVEEIETDTEIEAERKKEIHNEKTKTEEEVEKGSTTEGNFRCRVEGT